MIASWGLPRLGAFEHQCSPDHFEQKLENLNVSAGFRQVAPPGVEAVLLQKKAVLERRIIGVESAHELLGKRADVLRVVDDLQPLPVLVGLDPVETLEHLISLDEQG